MSDEKYYRYIRGKFLLRSLGMAYVALSVYAVIGLQEDLGWLGWRAGLAAALLQWMIALSLIFLVLLLWPRRNTFIGLGFQSLALLTVFFPGFFASPGKTLAWLLPGGWVNQAYDTWLASGGIPSHAWALIVAPLLVLPLLVRWQQSSFPQQALSLPDLNELEGEHVSDSSVGVRPRAGGTHEAITLAGPNWAESGWIERVVAWWLTSKQKVTAEFLLGARLGLWTGGWKVGLVLSLVGIALSFLRFVPDMLIILTLITATIAAVPVLGGRWAAFEPRIAGAQVSPLHSAYPIGYWEASVIMLKANAVIILGWTPLAILDGLVLGWRLQFSTGLALGIVVSVVFATAALQPALVAAHFSFGTDDTRRFSWGRLMVFLVILVAVFGLVTLVAALFFTPPWSRPFVGMGILFISAGAWLVYGWAYSRGKVDLDLVKELQT